MNYKIFFALALIGIALAGCTQTQPQNPNTGNQDTAVPTNATVTITEAGYEPQNVTIKMGGTVTWTSATDREDWPASAMHPTHTVYPGSGIEKCGTAEQPGIFDACKALANGESFSFTFNEVGEWPYHEHLAVKTFGKITVTE